ncbi:MAG: protein kinase family protein [Tissierella sp.]|uniref:protein kinase family protein n=1 Tax=Tissierella sp. TaxID=41274 RepID=UPI003F9E874C
MGLEENEILEFTRSKDYIFKKFIGQGGTGKTALLKDEILDTYFVCKKYLPSNTNDKEDCFLRFIDEIKILYLLSHTNIVRIYNYYLYPLNTAGFIIMEYIDGQNIREYLFSTQVETFENVFIQLIEGFSYMEENSIIHRDIKPDNVLITKEGVVKIIDFGFGKNVIADNTNDASVLLNWPVSELPDEVSDWKYDHKTDIYFLGKMFIKLLEDNCIENFKYEYILDRMIITNPDKRIESFTNILNSLSNDVLEQIDFTEYEKSVYIRFATDLCNHINFFSQEPKFENNYDIILENIGNIIKESALETYIQNNNYLVNCFLIDSVHNYNYNKNKDIYVKHVIDFYKLLSAQSNNTKNIVIENIIARLKSIEINEPYSDIPF